MIGPARSHRRGARPPLRGCAGPVGALGRWPGLAYAHVGPTDIVVAMKESQRLPQALLTLAERADPPSHRRDLLADGQVEALHAGGLALPATGRQHLLDRPQGQCC